MRREGRGTIVGRVFALSHKSECAMTSFRIDNPDAKKFLPVVLIVGLVLAVFYMLSDGSGGDNAGAVIEKQASVMENYIEGMESAQSADDVVKAIERYTAEMKELIPQLQKFYKTYDTADAKEMSAHMEKEMDRVKEGSEKLPAAMMKAASYMMNEKVQKAFAKMGEELGALDDFQ